MFSKILFASEQRMSEMGNLKEEVTSLNSQLRWARHDATRSGNHIIELKKLLDCTKRTSCNETEKIRSLEHVLRNEIATGQTALARANVRIENQNKEISSLHSLRKTDGEFASIIKKQETKLKQPLNENKNLNQHIGDLESTQSHSAEKIRSLEQKIIELKKLLAHRRELASLQQHDGKLAASIRKQEIELKQSLNENVNLKQRIEDLESTLKREAIGANIRIQNQNKEISWLHSLRQTDGELASKQETKLKQSLNENKNYAEKLRSMEQKITSLNQHISSEQTKLQVAHRELTYSKEAIKREAIRANVRIQNQSKEIASLQSLRQKDGKLADNQEIKLKQFLHEKKNLTQRLEDLESTLKTLINKSPDECSLCYEIVRY